MNERPFFSKGGMEPRACTLWLCNEFFSKMVVSWGTGRTVGLSGFCELLGIVPAEYPTMLESLTYIAETSPGQSVYFTFRALMLKKSSKERNGELCAEGVFGSAVTLVEALRALYESNHTDKLLFFIRPDYPDMTQMELDLSLIALFRFFYTCYLSGREESVT